MRSVKETPINTTPLTLTRNEKQLIKSFSRKRKKKLKALMFIYANAGVLDRQLFETILIRMQRLNPSIQPEKIEETANGDCVMTRSLNYGSFFRNEGNRALCYGVNAPEKPLYYFKKIHSDRFAKRETKHSISLNRPQSFWYHCDREPVAMLEWVKGIPLENYQHDLELKNSMTAHPFIRRLTCLASILRELNKLHLNLYAHNDLHSGNVIVDLQNDQAHLIDFEKTSKIGNNCSMMMDVIKIPAIIDLMFPDLSQMDDSNVLHHAVFRLKKSAQYNTELNTICNSEQMLEFLEAVIKNYASLNLEQLSFICTQTIDRTEPTLEDKIRGGFATYF